jgi:hypothetical protein
MPLHSSPTGKHPSTVARAAAAYFGAIGIAVVGLLLVITLLVLPLLHAP